MTADERIEKLLNRYGQTISNLPKPEYTGNGFFKAGYSSKTRHVAANTVLRYILPDAANIDQQDKGSMLMALEDYICHQADVIDRMEAALETATRWYPCECCEYGFTDDYWEKRCPCYKNEEYEESGFRIDDKLLTDEMED